MTGYIAIGCAPEDIGTAKTISEALKNKKIKSRILPVGETDSIRLNGKTKHEIRNCQLFLLIYSDNSARYSGLLKETDTAEKKGIPVLPYNSTGTDPVPPYDLYLTGSHCVSVLQDGSCNTEPICDNVKQLVKEHKKEANSKSRSNIVASIVLALSIMYFSFMIVGFLLYYYFNMPYSYIKTKGVSFTYTDSNETYCGEINSDDQFDGIGRYTYENENGYGILNGEWKNGEKNGIVNLTFYSNNGWQYYITGTYINDVLHGYGQEKLIYEDGQISDYSGEYKWGRKEGEGYLVMDNVCDPENPDCKKMIYEGDWKNGLPDGYGTETVELYNGDTKFYEGDFKAEEHEGNGKLIYTSVSEGYTETSVGEFKMSQLCGQAKRTRVYDNGNTTVYEGEFFDDKPNGIVTLTIDNTDGYHFFAKGVITPDEKFEDGTSYTEYDPEVGAERTGVFADGEKVYNP